MLLQGSRYLQCQGAVPHRTANLTTTTSSGRWDLEFALTKFITTCVFACFCHMCSTPKLRSWQVRIHPNDFFLRHVLSTRTETVSAVLKSRCSFILASFIWISCDSSQCSQCIGSYLLRTNHKQLGNLQWLVFLSTRPPSRFTWPRWGFSNEGHPWKMPKLKRGRHFHEKMGRQKIEEPQQ